MHTRRKKEPQPASPPIRWLLIAIGVLFTGVGFIGIFVPLLPTTPFLLLAAACFMRSSERLYNRLMDHRLFGTYIRNYRTFGAMTRRAKTGTLGLLWVTLFYAVLFVSSNLYLRLFLLLVGAGVTVHVLSLKTVPTKSTGTDHRQN